MYESLLSQWKKSCLQKSLAKKLLSSIVGVTLAGKANEIKSILFWQIVGQMDADTGESLLTVLEVLDTKIQQ